MYCMEMEPVRKLTNKRAETDVFGNCEGSYYVFYFCANDVLFEFFPYLVLGIRIIFEYSNLSITR